MSSLFFSKEQGHGRPLIFLHGFCETHEIWKDFIEPFTSNFRVITLDLPGFGNSEMLPSPFTIDQVSDAVANWLIENQLEKSIIIGHSLGGYVALGLAENHRNLLGSIVLFHSSVFADSAEKRKNRDRVIEFVGKNGVQPFIDTFVAGLFFNKNDPSINDVHRIASQTKLMTLISYSQAMRDRPDRSAVLKNNEIPKLLIAGEEDALIPIAASKEMDRMAKNLSFFELKNVAHMGFFEAKTECQQIILRFANRMQSNR